MRSRSATFTCIGSTAINNETNEETKMTILLTITSTITILFLIGLALKLAGYEDKQAKELREKIEMIMKKMDGEASENNDNGGDEQ